MKSLLNIPNCISETATFEAETVEVYPDHLFKRYKGRNQQIELSGNCLLAKGEELPKYISKVVNNRIYTGTLTETGIQSNVNEFSTANYKYLISHNNNWRTIFPDLNFLICPKLQRITNTDLDNGKQLTNIAGDFPVTLTNSNRYLYPDKRLLYISEDGWFNYNVSGVEKYSPLWSTYPYNMFGAVAYPSKGHYCVALIYEHENYNYSSSTAYNGIELQQNAQNWNASGMYHFKGGTSRRLGYNQTYSQIGNNVNGTCIIIFNIDIDPDKYPVTYIYNKNLTTNRVFVDRTYTREIYITPPQTINIYIRSVLNNFGRVKWFGIFPKTLNETETTVLIQYLTDFAAA